jgi:diguanylate cyclase (GGDEF)-like protein
MEKSEYNVDKEFIKVLLVEDDEDDYIMTRDLLSEITGENFELEWVSTYNPALESMQGNNCDVYLLDYRLGEHTGLDLMRKAMKNGCRGPVIILTGQGDREIDLEAMKAGAADYLLKKQLNAPLLERSIRYAIQRKRTEDHIFRMAYYDDLTRLPNRVLFQDRLRQAIVSAERNNNLAAVLLLDIDNFKRINDTFGHHMADQLLSGIGDRLNDTMRKTDSIAHQSGTELFARIGGDEFTVLLNEIRGVADAARIAKRIIESLSRPFTLDNNEIFITTSIGMAIFPDDGRDVDSLLKNADAALYHAKEQGKNNFQYYRQSMNAAAFERLTMENDLRKAIERNELLLYYQPQIDLRTGKISGMEALLRWNHHVRGMIMPSDFIPLAEDTGLIIPISKWIMHTACVQNKAWQKEGLQTIPVSVNLSSLQFRQKNILGTILQVLEKSKLKPDYLILEITESSLMENTEETFATLNALSELGLRLAIDDFGTGYSSLSYLKRFPLYAIKIDRSFIKGIPTNPGDAAIVKAIIAMAHSLELQVVAEGVETEEQLDFLRNVVCDEMQGFLFSRPLPSEELSKLLIQEKEGTVTESSPFHKIIHICP